MRHEEGRTKCTMTSNTVGHTWEEGSISSRELRLVPGTVPGAQQRTSPSLGAAHGDFRPGSSARHSPQGVRAVLGTSLREGAFQAVFTCSLLDTRGPTNPHRYFFLFPVVAVNPFLTR